MAGVAVHGGSIPFDDLDEARSPVFGFTRNSMTAVRVGKVAGANLASLYLELFNTPPYPPGKFPGVAWLYVDTVSIKPFPEPVPVASSNDVPIFQYYEVTINYGPLSYENDQSTPGQPLITRRYGFGGEFMTVPVTGLLWVSTGLPVEADEFTATKTIPQTEHSITWHRAPSVPATAIRANIGKINDGVLNNRYFNNVPDNSLLYLGAEINFSITTDGTTTWTIEHRFSEKRIKSGASIYGWNHFYNPIAQEWDELITDADDYMYPESANFGDLFV